MSSEMERMFVDGAARTAYVMAWATKRDAEDIPGVHRMPLLPDATPDYAREWAWKLLGALEEINPQWGRNLPSICTAAAHADHAEKHPPRMIGGKVAFLYPTSQERLPDPINVRAFGSNIAMMALGTGVSWFDDHARFELRVPDWSAGGGLELED